LNRDPLRETRAGPERKERMRPYGPALACLAILIGAGAVGADAGRAAASGEAKQLAIVDYGLYAMRPVRSEKAPHHVSGERTIVDDIRHVKTTRLVNAQLGRVFGFRFRVTDPALDGARLTLRIRFPELTNPRTGRRQTRQEDQRTVWLHGVYQQAYGFDHVWEMAEGEWTYQVLHEDRVLAEQRFTVVVPLN